VLAPERAIRRAIRRAIARKGAIGAISAAADGTARA
jgi:hypothetical protein